jgi:hypothetical protein
MLSGEDFLLHERCLQETANNSTNPAPKDDSSRVLNEGETLRNTVRFYGSILLVIWLLFCWLRLKYPRPFTIRRWTPRPELKTRLAVDQYGFFSWAWMLNTLTDDEILDHCGLDALCFLRTLSMGYKICLLGVFNSYVLFFWRISTKNRGLNFKPLTTFSLCLFHSIWLIPVYKTAGSSEATEIVTGTIVSITVSNIPPGSMRFIATVIASYLLFGFCMVRTAILSVSQNERDSAFLPRFF